MFKGEVVDGFLDVEADGVLGLERRVLKDGWVVEDDEELAEEGGEDQVGAGDVDAGGTREKQMARRIKNLNLSGE